MAWVLTAGLQNLRSQVNERFPARDKSSDGTIGDAAHQAETSGHNPDDTPGSSAEWDSDSDNTAEVRAWDMDSDLRESGATAQMVVDHIRSLPNVASVLRYIIYNRKIYRSTAGFAPVAYTGASAHTEHIHFSGAYSQASDNNTSFNYKLDEVNMPSLQEILSGIGGDLQNNDSGIAIGVRKQIVNVLNGVQPFVGPAGDRLHAAGWSDKTLMDLTSRFFELIGAAEVTAPDGTVSGGSVLDRFDRVEAGVSDVKADIDEVLHPGP